MNRFYIAIISLLLLTSCAALKQRKAERQFDKNPEKALAYLNKHYPVSETVVVKDSLHIDTAYLISETLRVDTLTIAGQTVYLSRPCPPAKVITQTKYQERTITKRDSAGMAALHYSIQTLNQKIAGKEADYNKLQGKHSVVRKWLLGVVVSLFLLLVLIVVYVVLKTKRIIPI